MSKQEFLDTLRRVLARELSESEVADNINYYWNYIEEQIASGKSEEQVLSELGDPRLIAKTILQVDQKREEAEDGAERFFQGAMYADEPEDYRSEGAGYTDASEEPGFRGNKLHVYKMTAAGWIRVALAILVILMILGAIFHVLWRLLPFFAIAALVLWVYRKITER